jgi:hypothetical protein
MIIEHQLKSRTAAYWLASLILCFAGTVVLANEDANSSVLEIAMPLLVLATIFALLRFCWYFLKARGRSLTWMLLLAFNVFGLLALLCLTDKTPQATRH